MEKFDPNIVNGFRLLDIIDILLVAIIIYYIYSLIKGTIAVNILIGVALFYGVFLVVKQMEMRLLTEIFGGFISVGSIALIVVFQQEIRRFLIHIGKNISLRRKKVFWSFLGNKKTSHVDNSERLKPIIDACRSMSKSRTGALLVFSRYFDEEYYQTSGEYIDAPVSKRLLEAIFFKNSPLHDGAVVIVDFRIMTASSVLPISDSDDLPPQFGLRHRAAIGVTEVSEAISVIVSEETGEISLAQDGNVNMNLSPDELERLLNEGL
ncbi:MAG: diadenylate cyclase CdaA [Sphingobacterium sp.]|uniref:diadenylate cyclase CdaA n=1 Tax=Sphingobacterium sp. JB170 TaxID=1434842 RepID=UPI00097F083E|nr:diadenylate cyclase CdaA [Sphingobacterium sp. JB170]SJN47379.1 Diadenylate cyclase spyDAC; Bacterial checkpoint controller DisA with nucleotide-binding domain [Sphingobacterium sp. JB170]